ncbi:MAG: TrkA C-terminal domain-containing protein [Campylobacterota bacterium]|nr:TrkA C-terminal domain-containing protein [Campylobacterota bacterium]
MKKILIIADGDIGEHFIKRIINTYTSENIYYVVQLKHAEYKNINHARFKFYEFDPTSLYKLANLLKMDFVQVIVAMQTQVDTENTLKNIRLIKDKLRVIILNRFSLTNEDPNVILINSNEILSSKLLDYLPNVPVIAQNIGTGEGEIMEVLVPFGSSFVYKHIGVIEQKNWKIVAIYRNKKLILPTRRRMIQPNDLLVLIGKPSVLQSVYRSIKQELGQFPEPFGSNIYLCIDMKLIKNKDIEHLVQQAVFLHKKFKHELIIKIINPSDFDILGHIKQYRSENIIIDIEYNNIQYDKVFYNDIIKYHVGLIIVAKDMFSDYNIRNLLYNSHVPVLKLSNKSFDNVKDAIVVLSDNRDLEKVASTIYDISEQLGFNIELYNYLSEHQEDKEQIIEHFYNLSTIFSKSIKVIKEKQNPIRVLKQKDDFIQILPFTNKLTSRRIFSLFSNDSEKLYYKLDNYHQIFIPVQL